MLVIFIQYEILFLGNYTNEPVENIFWKKDPPKGKYKVVVWNFSYHKGNSDPVPYTVSQTIDGVTKIFNLVSKGVGKGSSNQTVSEFVYPPPKPKPAPKPVTKTVGSDLDQARL